MSSQVMTIKELAKYLDITEATIYKKVSNNEIPYTKLGTLLRFPKWAIDRWISENTVEPPDVTVLYLSIKSILTKHHFHFS